MTADHLDDRLHPIFGPLAQDLNKLLSTYSNDQRDAIGGFLVAATEIMRDHTSRITSEAG